LQNLREAHVNSKGSAAIVRTPWIIAAAGRRDEASSERIFLNTILAVVGKNCNDQGRLIWPQEANLHTGLFSPDANADR